MPDRATGADWGGGIEARLKFHLVDTPELEESPRRDMTSGWAKSVIYRIRRSEIML
jgi:hypothetical protein